MAFATSLQDEITYMMNNSNVDRIAYAGKRLSISESKGLTTLVNSEYISVTIINIIKIVNILKINIHHKNVVISRLEYIWIV